MSSQTPDGGAHGAHSILDAFRLVFARPHPAGTMFLAGGGIVALAGLVFHLWPVLAIGIVFTLFCLYFFRDPERVTSALPDVLVAPADGRITSIVRAVPPVELGMGPEARVRIAIFLSVLNVHVNRVPGSGTVLRVARRPGRFLNAALDKASDENERVAFSMRLDETGETIAVVQIAGLIARRILCDVTEGQAVARGARFGIIRFGSRTDLYLPEGWQVRVREGQLTIGGETLLAEAPGRAIAAAVPEPVAVAVVTEETTREEAEATFARSTFAATDPDDAAPDA